MEERRDHRVLIARSGEGAIEVSTTVDLSRRYNDYHVDKMAFPIIGDHLSELLAKVLGVESLYQERHTFLLYIARVFNTADVVEDVAKVVYRELIDPMTDAGYEVTTDVRGGAQQPALTA